MGRLIWFLGELVAGVLLGGLVAGLLVPVMMHSPYGAGPGVVWASAMGCVLACVIAGERLRRRRNPHAP
jgi:hypothetical protein